MSREGSNGAARPARLWAAAVAATMAGTGALAQDTGADVIQVLPDIQVFGTVPLPGTGVPIDKVPSNVSSVGEEDIRRTQPRSVTELLSHSVGSAAAVDVQNNPYQQNLEYRGFTASPLLGDPQGLAIYQNGVRINEPFGDVVQWDLIPEAAIRDIDLVNANPAFGLNALGGALAIRLHDGYSFEGVEGSAEGGYFSRVGSHILVGGVHGRASGFLAAEYDSEDGWRNTSPSELRRLYADVGLESDTAAVHFNFAYADTELGNTDASPVELLAVNRRAVFTSPDITDNELFLGAVQGSAELTDTISLQGNAYFRRLVQTTFNGDEMEAEACEFDTPAFEALFNGSIASRNPMGLGADEMMCAEEVADDGAAAEAQVILDQFGNVVPLFADYHGALNTSSTQTTGYGFGLQGAIDDDLLGHTNQLVVGGSVDIGETRYHSESGIGMLNLDRSVTPGPEPYENTAVFDFGTDGVDTEGDPGRGDIGPARAVADNAYYGLYVSDTFDVTDNLSVTASGRFNYASIEIVDELSTFIQRDVTLDGSHRFRRFNPAAGATYTMPAIRTTAFASYAEASRAPSPVELTCAEPTAPCRLPNAFIADPPLKQVVARTVEAGVRGNFPSDWLGGASSLDWTASVFRSEVSDDIIFVSAGPTLGTGFFQNVDETRRQGFELGLGGDAGRARWFVNYSFIESTFESAFTVASPNHPLAVAGEILVEAGDDIPGLPQHNFSAGIDVEVLDGLTVGTSVVARSGVYLRGDEANLLARTDPYAVVNLRTSYRIADWLELFGRIENVFDTDYETFGVLGEAEGAAGAVPIYELPGGVTNPRFLSPGQPFAALVGARIRLN